MTIFVFLNQIRFACMSNVHPGSLYSICCILVNLHSVCWSVSKKSVPPVQFWPNYILQLMDFSAMSHKDKKYKPLVFKSNLKLKLLKMNNSRSWWNTVHQLCVQIHENFRIQFVLIRGNFLNNFVVKLRIEVETRKMQDEEEKPTRNTLSNDEKEIILREFIYFL